MKNSTVQIKFFLGFPLKGELKMIFNQTPFFDLDHQMVKAHFHENEYIGFSFEAPISYDNLIEVEKELKSLLREHYPKLNMDTQKASLFPELFLK